MSADRQLGIVRTAYAKNIMAAAGAIDRRVEAAFASVPREDFLGPGPWPIFRGIGDYELTPDTDPTHLYTNNLVGIVPERGLNNGQPTLHAFLLAQAKPAEGEHIVHIGTGTGYYTAIMAELVGRSGRVTGIEYDPELAARAKAILAYRPRVRIVQGDGATAAFDQANVIYVNAGATRPADAWLDRLTDGGRLILPLTTARGFAQPGVGTVAMQGSVFLIERSGDDFHAKWISPVAIFPCAGARDDTSEQAFAKALSTGRWGEVTRLYRRDDLPDAQCFLKAPGWCLAYS